MDNKDKIDMTLKKISRFDSYIISTNAKASIVIAWNGIVIGTILLKYHQITSLFDMFLIPYYLSIIIIFIIGISSIIAIAYVFQVVYPFLETKEIQDDDNSLFFFGAIAKMSYSSYREKEISSKEDEVLDDVLEQAHILAKGLNEKMHNLRHSINFIKCQLISICLLLIMKLIISFIVN